MKRISIAIVMTAAILLSACTHTDSPSMASTPQIPDINEISPQALPAEVAEKSLPPSPTISAELITETPGLAPSPTIFPELTTDDLKQYLNMKMSEIEEAFGEEICGTEAIMESHMVSPCIFIEGLGLTFIFPNDFEDLKPLFLEVGGESYRNNISIKGVIPGMDFDEIMDKLGGQVSQTWIANEECIYYQIVYKTDGLVYQFVSYDEEGSYTWLYISLDR